LAVAFFEDLVGGGGNLEVGSGDTVEVRYTQWLFDTATGRCGKELHSNIKSPKGHKFRIGKGKVIKGWDEGMIGMRKGGQRVLCLPPDQAYGATGSGDLIPPNRYYMCGCVCASV